LFWDKKSVEIVGFHPVKPQRLILMGNYYSFVRNRSVLRIAIAAAESRWGSD